MTDATARVTDAARKMAAHYQRIFAGMDPRASSMCRGQELTQELTAALAAMGDDK